MRIVRHVLGRAGGACEQEFEIKLEFAVKFDGEVVRLEAEHGDARGEVAARTYVELSEEELLRLVISYVQKNLSTPEHSRSFLKRFRSAIDRLWLRQK